MTRLGVVLLAGALAASVAACASSETVRSDDGPSALAATVPDGATSTTESSGDATPKDPASIYLSAPIAIPAGEPGKLSVVLTGPPTGSFGSSVPVIVRNNEDEALTDIQVTGTAREANGVLAGSGSSQGFKPFTVQPGEWAMGYVYFSSEIPADAALDLTATGSKRSGALRILENVDLPVVEANLVQGQFGTAEVAGIASNPSTKILDVGASVILTCFVDGKPISAEIGSTAGAASIAAGGTAPFSVSLYEQDCPVYAIGASGYASE
jgi:hypothetical protein